MSKAYREKFGDKIVSAAELRSWLRPQFGATMTEQQWKDTCDVNKIIRKYDKTGLIVHVSKFNAEFGDVSGLDFKASVDKIVKIRQEFDAMPSEIRKRFKNDPGEMLAFMSDSNNREEAIKIGLIRNDWTLESDGMGEKVPIGKNVKKPVEKKPETPAT